MKKTSVHLITILVLLLGYSCTKDSENTPERNIQDVSLKINFNSTKTSSAYKVEPVMTYETPDNYYVALKRVVLLGTNGTADFELFNEADLASSFVFDFTATKTVHSLLQGTTVPHGEYSAFELEIYYLQMNISIATVDRGLEKRDFRIYLSDDAETEGGLHQPGDMTQINNGIEIGWLLGEGQTPNLDPVAPRQAAYTYNGEVGAWYDFAGKSGENFGPFGDVDFMNNAPHPIYSTQINFNLNDQGGTNLILNFDVTNCWQFEDKSGDGVFGAADLDPVNPTNWHMELPATSVTLE
ncbi:MAG: hypothetical protein JW857_08050 [Bacteroidales bacterium]|nr:hypothetical protein [Bacteroidales bacterium]